MTGCYIKIIKFLKGLYTDLFPFLGKFSYSFDSKQRENIQRMNWKDDHIYTVSDRLSAGGHLSVPNFEMGGLRNKISATGTLRVPATDICLEGLYVPCQKRL